jgi:hypothetical protein
MPQGRKIRQELVFTANENFSARQIASFMLTFSNYVLARNQALLRGDIIGPSEPLISDVAVNSVYASIPVLFDESFNVYRFVTTYRNGVVDPLAYRRGKFCKR